METKVTAVNGHGHLTIGGLDTVALASKYGTPLYVMDEDAIRVDIRRGAQDDQRVISVTNGPDLAADE